MNLSMSVSKSGMKAQQLALDAISHNIANADTDGYKTKTTSFQSLMLNQLTEEDVLLNMENQAPGLAAGVRSGVTGVDFSQGSLSVNTRDLQLAVMGEGFFGVDDAAGNRYLTRDGSFTRNNAGQIVNGSGDRLVIQETLPAAEWPAGTLTVSENGSVFVQMENDLMQVGTIPVYLPENEQQLLAVGDNKFVLNEGEALVFAGGRLQQFSIERSNVDLAQQMTNMMVAQRAYSLNLKAAQSTDDMMSMINQFNR